MAKTRMKHGAVVIPQSVRDAHGLEDGVELEVIDGEEAILLRPVAAADTSQTSGEPLTVEAFLTLVRSFPRYDGPPVSDAMMREAVAQAAFDDWGRLERQRNEDKDD